MSSTKTVKKSADIGLSAKERIFVHALRSLFDSKDEKGKGKAAKTAKPGWGENRKGLSVGRTQGKAKAAALGDNKSENRVRKQIHQTDSKMTKSTVHPPFWRAGPGGPNETRRNAIRRIFRTHKRQTERASNEGVEVKTSRKVTKKQESKGAKVPKITVKREPEATTGKKWTPSKLRRAEKRVDLTAMYRQMVEERVMPPTKANLRLLKVNVQRQRAERSAKVLQRQQLPLTDILPKGVRELECVEAWGGAGCLSLLAKVKNIPTKDSYGFRAYVELGGHPFRDYKKAAKGLTQSHLETDRKQKTRLQHNFRVLAHSRKASVAGGKISVDSNKTAKPSNKTERGSVKTPHVILKTDKPGQGSQVNSSQVRRLERRRAQRVSNLEETRLAAEKAAQLAEKAASGKPLLGKDRILEVLRHFEGINMLQRPVRHDYRRIVQALDATDESHEWFTSVP
jgi:hypothetical protein